MAEWRQTGYVPDSDNEDEDLVGSKGSRDEEVGSNILLPYSKASQGVTFNNEPNTVCLGQVDLDSDDNPNPHLSQSKSQNDQVCLLPEIYEQEPKPIAEVNPELSAPVIPTSSTAEKLREELERGLEIARKYAQTPPIPAHDENLGISPLSSPLSSLGSISPPAAEILDHHAQNLEFPEQRVLDAAITSPTGAGGLRALRRRAPIQLHPYALEDAAYRQALRGRGLKPIRVLQDNSESQFNPLHEEVSQEKESWSVDQEGAAVLASSQILGGEESQSPVRPGRRRKSVIGGNPDEELPELSQILNGVEVLSPAARRRRKGLHVPRLPRPRRIETDALEIFDLPSEEEYLAPTTSIGTDPAEATLLPSPPRSAVGTAQNRRQPRFGLTGDEYQSTLLLPTPDPSSEPPSRKRSVTELSNPDSVVENNSAHRSDESASSEDDESKGLHRVQRRIRGVLPASWLKLDLKKQNPQNVGHVAGLSPAKRTNEKGVATKVRSRNPVFSSTKPSLDETLQSDNDSDSSIISAPPVLDVDGVQFLQPQTIPGMAGATVIEDNTIDAMLPTTSRKRKSQPHPKKRQKRLHDSWMGGERPRSSGQDTSRYVGIKARTNRSSGIGRHHRQGVVRHRRPLTILDAPDMANGILRKDRPLFLRVAARRRNGRAARPQDPRVKVLQLATTKDTQDINQELINWDISTGRSMTRPPEASTDAEAQSSNTHYEHIQPQAAIPPYIASDSNGDLQALKTSTRLVLQQISNRRQRNIGSVAATQLLRHPENAIPVPLSRYQSRSNRAGAGLLFNRGHKVRNTELFGPNSNERNGFFERAGFDATNSAEDVHQPSFQQSLLPLGQLTPKDGEHRDTLRHLGRVEHASQRRGHRLKRSKMAAPPNGTLAQTTSFSPDDEQGQGQLMLVSSSAILSSISHTQPNPCIHLAIHVGHQLAPLQTGRMFDRTTMVGRGVLFRLWTSVLTALQALGLTDPICPSFQSLPLEELPTMHTTQTVVDLGRLFCKAKQYVQEVIDTSDAGNTRPNISVTDLTEILDNVLQVLGSEPFRCGHFDKQEIRLETAVTELHTIADVWLASSQSPSLLFSSSSRMILTRLLVFSFELVVKVIAKDCDKALQSIAVTTYGMFAKLTMLACLPHDNSAALLQRLLEGEMPLPEEVTPSAEGIVILLQFCRITSNIPGMPTMNVLLTWLLQSTHSSTPASELSRSLCTISTVVLLSQIDVSGNIIPIEQANSSFTNWEVIMGQVERFLDDHMVKGKPKPSDNMQLGYATLRWFHSLWYHWNCFEHKVLKAIFKAFATNEMKNLFNSAHKPDTSFLEKFAPDVLRLKEEDSDFDVFLKLVAITLRDLQNRASTMDRKIGDRTRSLVFSLSPNSGRGLHQNLALELIDLIALENKYALYQTLYRHAPPGSKPRLTYVENLIDFEQSHDAVCSIAINAWGALTKFCLADALSEDLPILAAWMSRMLRQLKAKHALAHTEVLDVLMKNAQPMSTEARKVIHYNQEGTSKLLQQCIDRWSYVVTYATTLSQLSNFLSSGSIEEVLRWLRNPLELGENVALSILSLLKACFEGASFARKEISIHKALHDQFHQILFYLVLMNDLSKHESVLRNIAALWFCMAEVMQRCRGSWDDYLDTHGALSFNRLPDTAVTRHLKTYFLAKLVSKDRMYLDLNRVSIIAFWIEGLLQPKTLFEAELTWHVLQNDPEVLSLDELQDSLMQNDVTEHNKSWISRERLFIVCFLIRQIYCLQYVETDDFYETGLDRERGAILLRVMMHTMKSTWLTVRNTPEQTQWTEFIHAVLIELKVYHYADFSIDPWFLDDKEFPCPQRVLRDEFRLGPGRPTGVLTKQTIQKFQKQVERTLSTGGLSGLACELIATFASQEVRGINTGSPQLDIPLAIKFIELVFPSYLENALLTEPGHMMSIPIMLCLIDFVKSAYLRLNESDISGIWNVLRVLVSFLNGIRKAMQGMHPAAVKVTNSAAIWRFLGLAFNLTALTLVQYHQIADIADGEGLDQSYQAGILETITYIYQYSICLRSTPSILPHEVGNLDEIDLDHSYDFGLQALNAMGELEWLTKDEREIVSWVRDKTRHEYLEEWQRDPSVAGRWMIGSAKLQVQLDDHVWSIEDCQSVALEEAMALRDSVEFVMK